MQKKKILIMIDPIKIIETYYNPKSEAHRILIAHGEAVAKKALELAERVKDLNPDLGFIKEAAMLHDMGIFLTSAPKIDCHGDKPYIAHGYLGRELLVGEGLPGMHRMRETCWCRYNAGKYREK
jgi:uncharacterized protein